MRFLSAAVLILLTACDSPSELDDRWAVPEEITFASSLGIDLDAMNRTESGLYWQDQVPGDEDTPAVVLEDEVRFHYTIWLPDGRSLETSVGGTPYESEVILLLPGVAEGIIGMRRGGVRRLVIRPELVGPKRGVIPPRTTVVFQIDLLAIVT